MAQQITKDPSMPTSMPMWYIKKIYGMQAAVVLNLMHQGKDLLAFMK